MTSKHNALDITGIMLSALFISILTVGSFWVLRPFLSAIIWATMIVIPTWPLMIWLKEHMRGSRSLAVLVMTLILCALIFVPVWLVISTIVKHTDTIANWARSLMQLEMPAAPPWLASIPLVGGRIATAWERLAVAEQKDIAAKVTPYVVEFIKWFPSQLGNAGAIFVHLFLTLIIAIILYFQGELAAGGVRAFARRLAGDRGDQAVVLAAQAIKAVAIGIVVTALVQATVAGIGLIIAGIPFAILLTSIIFVLSVIQIGAWPVLAPTVIWLYWSGSAFWGTVILIWSVLVMSLDNVLRPYLIKRGANLPLLLIFSGVIGGLIAFGIIGLFVGPVILAVSYTLINAWISKTQPIP